MTTAVLDGLMSELRYRRFWLYQWGAKDRIDLLAMVRRWTPRQEVDVILLRGDDSAVGYRTIDHGGDSFLRPDIVCWQYIYTDPVWVFRAVYGLPEPGHPQAPTTPTPPHAECRIPEGLSDPLRVVPLGHQR